MPNEGSLVSETVTESCKAMSHNIFLHVVSEGVAKLKSLTLIRLRSDDDEKQRIS